MKEMKGVAPIPIVAIIIVAVIASVGVWYVTKPPTEEERPLIGQCWHNQFMQFHRMAGDAGDWFADDIGYITIRTNAELNPEIQISQAMVMLDQGIVGMILGAADADANACIAEMCADEGIPVITIDSDANSNEVDMFIGFDEVKGSETLAEKIVEHLEDKYGEPRGVVFNAIGGQTEACGINRYQGLKNVFDDYPNITTVDEDCHWSAEDTKEFISAASVTYGKPDAITYACGGQAPGAISALDIDGWTAKVGEPEHVWVGGYDSEPYVLDQMSKDRIDWGLEQPCLFYSPLAVYWVDQIRDKGRDALPEAGDVYTTDDIDISEIAGYSEHYGVDPWKYPFWGPAQVKWIYPDDPAKKHLGFICSACVFDKDTMDNPGFYGNMLEQMGLI